MAIFVLYDETNSFNLLNKKRSMNLTTASKPNRQLAKCTVISLLLALATNSWSQTFTDTLSQAFTGVYHGASDWGDFDNDGDLDLLVTGNTLSGRITKIYENQGNNNFVDVPGTGLPAVDKSAVKWGDYDHDGDLDILLAGQSSYGIISRVYANMGSGFFVMDSTIVLQGVWDGDVEWVDFDKDGDIDILVSGRDNFTSGSASYFYENTGNNQFELQTDFNIQATHIGELAWADYDNDGDLDLTTTGGGGSAACFYENKNGDSLILQSPNNIPYVYSSSIDWGDYDNDGDLDCFISGYENGYHTKLFKNNGNYSFAPLSTPNITPVNYCSAEWEDFNNDGFLDLLLIGSCGISCQKSAIYINNGNDSFTELTPNPFQGMYHGDASCADYDNDGDIDIFLSGTSGSINHYAILYQNMLDSVNVPPSVPQNLQVDSTNNIISWERCSDDITHPLAMSYNIIVGTPADPISHTSGHSNLSNGFRLTQDLGNEQLDTFAYFTGPFDSIYQARVQAIDITAKGSGFSTSVPIHFAPRGRIVNSDTSIICGFDIDIEMEIHNGESSMLTYSWTPSYGVSDTSIQNPTIQATENTCYKVRATSQFGYSFTDSITIMVSPISVDLEDSLTLALGDSILISPTLVYGGDSADVIWEWIPDLEISSVFEQTPYLCPSISRQYSLHVTSTEGCAPNKDSIWISVNPFVEVPNTNIAGLTRVASYWCDYDSDDDLDIIITGTNIANVPEVYINQGNNIFVGDTVINLPHLTDGSLDMGDFNNDGRIDLLFCGNSYPVGASTRIFKNTGNQFEELTATNIIDLRYGNGIWGDFDNDGDLDFVVTGNTNSNIHYTKMYQNHGDETFTEVQNTPFAQVSSSSLSKADYDNDGDLDLMVMGQIQSGAFITELYENQGLNSFVASQTVSFPGLVGATASWGDLDSDGDLDLLLSGNLGGYNDLAAIYENLGNGHFQEITNTNIPGMASGGSSLGDYNNDGLLDIVINGKSSGSSLTLLYENQGNWNFLKHDDFGLTNIMREQCNWADSDNDGDLDLLVGGHVWGSSSYYSVKLYENKSALLNYKPSVPQNLHYDSISNTIRWDASTDDLTNSLSISYNLAVGTLQDLASAKSPNANLINGFHKIADYGNEGLGTFSAIKYNFEDTLFAAVQSIDNALNSSVFSPSIPLPAAAPHGGIINDTLYYICGDTAQINILVMNGDMNQLCFSWSPSQGLSSDTIPNPLACPIVSTSYSVTATAPNGLSFQDSVFVYVLPIELDAGSEIVYHCANSTQLFPSEDYSGQDTSISWTWTPGISIDNPNLRNPFVWPSTETNYFVSLVTPEGCSANDSIRVSSINILDTIPPDIIAQNISVNLDANGEVHLAPTDIDNNSSDNCSIDSLSIDIPFFTCQDIGSHQVTLTGYDHNQNSATAIATVTVIDNTDPTAISNSVNLYLDTNGTTTITVEQVDNGSFDNCALASREINKHSFNCSHLGGQWVKLTVKDSSNNSSFDYSTAYIHDTLPPTAIAKDTTLYIWWYGHVSMTPSHMDNGSHDNCSMSSFDLNQTYFDCSNIGSNAVTFYAFDQSNNIDSTVANITIADTLNPEIILQDINVFLDSSGTTSISPADLDVATFDNCELDTVFLDQYYFDCSHLGSNTVLFTAVDVNSNTSSTTCQVTVHDSIRPTALCQDLTLYLDSSGMAIAQPGDADLGSFDECGIDTLFLSKDTFDCNDLGPNQHLFFAIDNYGWPNTCHITITVLDTIYPDIHLQDMTVYLDSFGEATLTVDQLDSSSYDNCGLDYSLHDTMFFDCSNIGTLDSVFTIYDAAGNSDSDTVLISILDSLGPLPDIAILPEITSECAFTLTTIPTAFDNCTGPIYATTIDSLSFGLGNYSITWIYTNTLGNTTTQEQNIVVEAIDTSVSVSGNTLTALASGYQYQWYDENHNPLMGATNQDYTIQQSGGYYVNISNGECDYSSGIHNIIYQSIVFPNDDELISLYPNPTVGVVSLLRASDKPLTIEVYDTNGKILQQISTQKKAFSISMKNYSSGIYGFRFITANKVAQKMIIKK